MKVDIFYLYKFFNKLSNFISINNYIKIIFNFKNIFLIIYILLITRF